MPCGEGNCNFGLYDTSDPKPVYQRYCPYCGSDDVRENGTSFWMGERNKCNKCGSGFARYE